MYVDVQTYLVDDILTKVDQDEHGGLARGARAAARPQAARVRGARPVVAQAPGGRSKYLLRRVLERRVPRVDSRAAEARFAAPIGEWLRGPLAPMAGDLLLDGRLRERGIFNARGRAHLDEHRSGRAAITAIASGS